MENCYICGALINPKEMGFYYFNNNEYHTCNECRKLIASSGRFTKTGKESSALLKERLQNNENRTKHAEIWLKYMLFEKLTKEEKEFSFTPLIVNPLNNINIRCPECQEIVFEDETTCPHCGKILVKEDTDTQKDKNESEIMLPIKLDDLRTVMRAPDVEAYCNDKLYIARESGQFAVVSNKKNHLSYQTASLNNMLEIKYYDDVQNIQVETEAASSGAGAAVVGGLLFGGIGAVAGGLMGRKDAIYQNVSHIQRCGFIVTYIDGKMANFNLLKLMYNLDSVETASDTFREVQSLTAAICSQLSEFLPQKEQKITAEEKPETNDIATQLKKMADLVEAGFVTREEFDSYKKKLLGL